MNFSLQKTFQKGIDKHAFICYNIKVANAGMAQSVEHVIGNDEVISSILITSSKNPNPFDWDFLLYPLTLGEKHGIIMCNISKHPDGE